MSNQTTAITFTAHTLNINGNEFPTEYSITPDGTVFVFTTMQDGEKTSNIKIKMPKDHEHYTQALHAAQQERAEREAKRVTPVIPMQTVVTLPQEAQTIIEEFCDPTEEPEQADNAHESKTQQSETMQSTQTEQPKEPIKPKAQRKEFVGMEIKGKGWMIRFDGEYDRTRVIFEKKPCEKVRTAVKEAGFYWSPVMKSWNKKLTNKAFMAAQNLAIELRKLCA